MAKAPDQWGVHLVLKGMFYQLRECWMSQRFKGGSRNIWTVRSASTWSSRRREDNMLCHQCYCLLFAVDVLWGCSSMNEHHQPQAEHCALLWVHLPGSQALAHTLPFVGLHLSLSVGVRLPWSNFVCLRITWHTSHANLARNHRSSEYFPENCLITIHGSHWTAIFILPGAGRVCFCHWAGVQFPKAAVIAIPMTNLYFLFLNSSVVLVLIVTLTCLLTVLFALYFFLGLSYSILPEFLFAQHFYFKPLLYFLPTGPFLSLHLFPVLLSLQSHPFLSGTHFLLRVITDSDICSKQKIWIHLTYFLSS